MNRAKQALMLGVAMGLAAMAAGCGNDSGVAAAPPPSTLCPVAEGVHWLTT